MPIAVESLSKTWRSGRVRALDGVSLAVAAGEILGVVGPNGAGKSTLLGCVLGLVRPDAGRVQIDGRSPDSLAAKASIGYVPERLLTGGRLTAREFLSLHHSLARRPTTGRRRDVEKCLDRVGMRQAATTPLARMSRGMLQRIALAQALLGEPRHLVLDEPTSGIDPVGTTMARELLREMRGRGASVILAAHQLDQVERTCDRVLFLSAGRVAREMRPTDDETCTRLVVARFKQAGSTTDAARLAAAATSAGARIHSQEAGWVRFLVHGDLGATELLRHLVLADTGVIELTPDAGRIERLFQSEETKA